MVKGKSNEPSEELLAYMGLYREEEPGEAEAAFNEFYKRYAEFVFKVVYKVCSNQNGCNEPFVQAVVNNTFYKVYARAETFDDGGIRDNPGQMESRIKAWLSSIAKNEFIQLLKRSIGSKEIAYDPELLPEPKIQEDHSPTSLSRTLVDNALASLTEREREILLTYMRFLDGKKKLPTEEMERLATLYTTTSDNIRQIKSRALSKVKVYIKTNSDYEID